MTYPDSTHLDKRKNTRQPVSFTTTMVAGLLALVVVGGIIFGAGRQEPQTDYLQSAWSEVTPETTALVQNAAVSPFEGSATALIATVTQQARDETLTALANFGIDPIVLTATAVIEEATQQTVDLTNAAEMTRLYSQVDPLVLSATALLATATQQALDKTLTADPFPPTEPMSMVITFTPTPESDTRGTRQLDTVDVVIAVQEIEQGQTITADMVGFRSMPEQYAPQNAVLDLEQVVGKIARTDIYREQPILEGLLTNDPNDLAIGSDDAGAAPAKTSIVLLPVSRYKNLRFILQPGDRADIKIGGETTLAYDVLIISIGELPEGGLIAVEPGSTRVANESESANLELVIVEALPQEGRRLVEAVEQQKSLTFTRASDPLRYNPVVIAREFIPVGTLVTMQMLATVYYPSDILPDDVYTSVDEVVGIVTTDDIRRGYPVVAQGANAYPIVTTTPPFTPTPAASTASTNSVVIPFSALQNKSTPGSFVAGLKPGDTVDVVVAFLFIDAEDMPSETDIVPDQMPMPRTLVENTVRQALVAEVQPDSTSAEGSITLQVSPQNAEILNYYLEAKMLLYLVPSEQSEVPQLMPTPTASTASIIEPISDAKIDRCEIVISEPNGITVIEYPFFPQNHTQPPQHLPAGTTAQVTDRLFDMVANETWYLLEAEVDGKSVTGWMLAEHGQPPQCSKLPTPTPE